MQTVIEINPAFQPAVSREDILAVADNFDGVGELIFSGRNRLRRVTVGGADVVVKRYKRFNAVRKVTRRFRPSKARRAYHNALLLIELGIKTPAPLAYVEKRNAWGALTDSYFICAYAPMQPLKSVMHDRRAIESFANFTARLHNLGIIHGDLNRSNVVFTPVADGAELPQEIDWQLIDINRMHFRDSLTLTERRANTLLFSEPDEVYETFARAYLRASGLPDTLLPSFIRAKILRDRRRTLFRAIKHPLRTLRP